MVYKSIVDSLYFYFNVLGYDWANTSVYEHFSLVWIQRDTEGSPAKLLQ